MTILHLLSQLEVTGAEVYAATLAQSQLAAGHRVLIVSDTFHTPTDAAFTSRPISEARLLQLRLNAYWLRRFLRREGVQVVHSHSRAASKTALRAGKGLPVGLISTVHGRQGWHGDRKDYDVYGHRILAVCSNICGHLVDELGIAPEKIRVLANPMQAPNSGHLLPADLSLLPTQKALLLAGRVTGPKGMATTAFLQNAAPDWLAADESHILLLAGGSREKLPPQGRQALANAEQRFPGRVHFLGFRRDLPALIAHAEAGVIGSGRVALEALLAGKPVFALGEVHCHGLVTEANLADCMASNFGDVATSRLVTEQDIDLLGKALRQEAMPLSISEQQHLAEAYDLATITAEVEQTYLSAWAQARHPAYIPVLMYHKILDGWLDSQHKIFVPKQTFERQLRQLHWRGYTSISFELYEAFRQGKATLPRKPIVLTFDDAYQDNYTNAWPLLKKYGFSATIYALGRPEHDHNFWDTAQGEAREALMTPAQKQEMAASGIEFGAHTQDHPDLTTLPPDEMRYQVEASRKALQALTGQAVSSFAYPYGRLTPEVKQAVAEAGFGTAVVISGGGLHWEDDRLEIFRVYIFPQDKGLAFYKKTSPWYRLYFRKKRGI